MAYLLEVFAQTVYSRIFGLVSFELKHIQSIFLINIYNFFLNFDFRVTHLIFTVISLKLRIKLLRKWFWQPFTRNTNTSKFSLFTYFAPARHRLVFSHASIFTRKWIIFAKIFPLLVSYSFIFNFYEVWVRGGRRHRGLPQHFIHKFSDKIMH